MNKYLSAFVFLLFINTSTAQYATSDADTSYRHNFFSTDLINNINSANLVTKLNANIPYKKFSSIFRAEYNSDVTKLDENFARDFITTNFNSDYIINSKFSGGAGFQSKSLSDDKNIEVNKVKNSYYYLNFNYKPADNIRLNTKIGIKNDEQIGESTSGVSGNLNTEVDRLTLSNFLISGRINLMNENLIQKKNHIYEINTSLVRYFANNSENNLIIKAHNHKNDFFLPATLSILQQYNISLNTQTREENLIYIQDDLKYTFLRNLRLHISGSAISRGYYNEYKYKPEGSSAIYENIYDTKVHENRFEASAKVDFAYRKFLTDFKVLFSERSEVHNLINSENLLPQQIRDLEKTEENKNSSSRISSVMLNFYLPVTNLHTIQFSGSSTMLRYDTDSKENSDDRDELYFNTSVSHIYNNLDNFNLKTSFEYNLTTLSYILKEKSANNNSNKIYRLTSRSEYKPFSNLHTINSFQVLANYTVYKFEDVLSQVQSYIFRQMQIWDTTRYDITSNIYANFDGNLRIYEQGQYNDENFSIKPSNYYVESLVDMSLNYNYEVITVGGGYRYFLQDQYIYTDGVKNLLRSYKNHGPFLNISFLFSNGSLIFLNAGRDTFETSDNPIKNKSNYLNLRVIWKI
ncbi:MAG: hypothetical protein JW917_02140 [Ignavibacteria bacterium]|nr:hypothetical protein [Ignavibacteria bacterium]